MKAAIYNPYLDTLGGGERYTMVVATTLAKAGYKVDVKWKNTQILTKLETRFGLDLSEVEIVSDINRGDDYDICFWVSDGSIPLLRARNNILHFQVPFQNVYKSTPINKMKFLRIKSVICNSNFTKSFIDKEYGVNSKVVYPPVDVSAFKPKRKENMILYVGRFSELMQSKGQDILVRAFKRLERPGWRLVLAGGAEIGAGKYVKKLKRLAKGYPIEIIESPSFEKIKSLYGKAKIFWSASGFGINERREPERVEHFGIAVVEAMAAGSVPIIYAAGGHKEIIESGKSGYLWKSTRQLLSYSRKLAEDNSLMRRLSESAKNESKKYSYQEFEKKLLALI